jgi:predicted phosphatase
LGINIEKFPVFFCGDTPKGLVIKTKINLSKFKDILFIDDLKYNLDNVKKELGEKVQCILFEKSNIG